MICNATDSFSKATRSMNTTAEVGMKLIAPCGEHRRLTVLRDDDQMEVHANVRGSHGGVLLRLRWAGLCDSVVVSGTAGAAASRGRGFLLPGVPGGFFRGCRVPGGCFRGWLLPGAPGAGRLLPGVAPSGGGTPGECPAPLLGCGRQGDGGSSGAAARGGMRLPSVPCCAWYGRNYVPVKPF